MANELNEGLVLFSATPAKFIDPDATFGIDTGLPNVPGPVKLTGAEVSTYVKRALAIKIKKSFNDRWDAAMAVAARKPTK